MLANHTYVILVSSLAARYALRTDGDTRVYASGTGRLMGPPCFIGTRHMKEISTASWHLLVNVNMSLPIPAVSVQQLVEARRLLGPVGVRPFRTYVQRTYGPLTEEMAREFLRMPVRRGAAAGDAITAQDTRMQSMAQVFAPAPASKGRVVATSPKSDWAVDTIDLRGRTKKTDRYRHILIAQNTYTGYIFALPLASTSPNAPGGTAATFQRILEQANQTDPRQGPPKAITTDSFTPGKGGNPEWQKQFQEMLTVAGIAHRMKQMEDRNAMGKLDATIRHVKSLLFKGVAESAQRDWVTRLPEAVKTYNERLGHEWGLRQYSTGGAHK